MLDFSITELPFAGLFDTASFLVGITTFKVAAGESQNFAIAIDEFGRQGDTSCSVGRYEPDSPVQEQGAITVVGRKHLLHCAEHFFHNLAVLPY